MKVSLIKNTIVWTRSSSTEIVFLIITTSYHLFPVDTNEGEEAGEGEGIDEQFKQEIRSNITNIISMASQQAEREEQMRYEGEQEPEGDSDHEQDDYADQLESKTGVEDEQDSKEMDDEPQQVEEEKEVFEKDVKESEEHEAEVKELELIETPKQTKNDLTESSRAERQSNNRLESSETELAEESDKLPKNIFKSRVSIVDIPKLVKTEFRLILQNQKIPFSKLHKIFPPTKRIGLQQLIDHFKSFKRFENDVIVEQICRYLVENDANGDVIHYDK